MVLYMTIGITLGILFGIGLGYLIDNVTARVIVGARCGAALANMFLIEKKKPREDKSR
jgi:uncharacterized membrane protein YfcA